MKEGWARTRRTGRMLVVEAAGPGTLRSLWVSARVQHETVIRRTVIVLVKVALQFAQLFPELLILQLELQERVQADISI